MSREGDGYGEVVRPECDKGELRHIARRVALGGERGGGVFVRISELRSVDRPINSFLFGHCPVISCSGESGEMAGVKVAKHHLVSTFQQKCVKVGGVVPGVGGRRGDIPLTKVSVVPQRSASTTRTSAVSK